MKLSSQNFGSRLALTFTLFHLAGNLLLPSAQAEPGAALWTNRFNAAGWGSLYLSGMAVAGNGNVVVTGYSDTGNSDDAFVTIACSGAGVPLWTNRYKNPNAFSFKDHPTAVTVDGSNNVLVTGYSYRAFITDFTTLKYSSTGTPLWTNRYHGPAASDNDQANAIAVDAGGNVYVTGTSYGIGIIGADFATIKYSSAGTPLWTNRYNRNNGDDFAVRLAVDRGSNVIVTGFSTASGGYDYTTIKYSPAGTPLWTNHYAGPGSSIDMPSALTIDVNSNIIVTGSSGPPGEEDFLTVKYSSAGVPLWTNRYDGFNHMFDVGMSVTTDAQGNVIVAGSANGGTSDYDYVTIKYTAAGAGVWTNIFEGPDNGPDYVGNVIVDAAGNIIVTGKSPVTGSDQDCLTVAYSSGGQLLWQTRYNGPGNGFDEGVYVGLNAAGSLFVAGTSAGASANDYLLLKLATSVPPPPLNYQRIGNQLVLSWTNAAYSLQTSAEVAGPYVPLGNPSPFTNTMTAARSFFRLIAN